MQHHGWISDALVKHVRLHTVGFHLWVRLPGAENRAVVARGWVDPSGVIELLHILVVAVTAWLHLLEVGEMVISRVYKRYLEEMGER